ncbi:hypothetical protein JJJ17_09425 [Paracoccus caeni]|uniref:Uncharacterized protein n=1 Tax=Paracoccus caeni TaxID=657651 RepID=A0A934SEZ5_9RHOB|nr:hypothetical protein [Paracoccus caeni]MBK4216145.1 hypothetical protein [Paracoccus caeni]
MNRIFFILILGISPSFALSDDWPIGFMELDPKDQVVATGFTVGIVTACAKGGADDFDEEIVSQFELGAEQAFDDIGIDLAEDANKKRYQQGFDAAPSYIVALGGISEACPIIQEQLNRAHECWTSPRTDPSRSVPESDIEPC